MISIKTEEEIVLMRGANAIVRDLLLYLEEHIKPGITTKRLDALAYDFIVKNNAKPSFLGFEGYPASICTSIDAQVVHGIPSERKLVEGEIISVDVGTIYKGYQGDAARTFAVGEISAEKQRLIDVTRESFFKGIECLKDGARLGDLGYAIQSYAEKNGYSVVRALTGHGIGREMHEDPAIPNFGKAGRGMRVKAGMTLAIEPMINMGDYDVLLLDDGWTVVTADYKPSAHYENTVLVTENGVEILSL
ncbi:MAG: type I methionyl aminopeptidase [Clostridia bacterium]|jgi:methionyl aminopeptidase|nr:type I methionyl aminopeptidase [Clostridia bacterium]MCX4367426.1 type I methionyl aminopeptidase [Clostridia bacterium]